MRKFKRSIAVTLPCALVFTLAPHPLALAQSKPVAPDKSPLCTRQNALEMIKQQADVSKTFNDPIRRITLLIRAAHLLWPYEQQKARAVFTEAFELATEREKEVAEKSPQSIVLRMQNPDQRHLVIRAIATHDSAWAKELAQQMLKTSNSSDATSARSQFENELNANRLLDSARNLIATDLNAALELARVSLNYPASSALTAFYIDLRKSISERPTNFTVMR